MKHVWMILETLSGFSNVSTVRTENWQAKGVRATEEVHLDNSKTFKAFQIKNLTCFEEYNMIWKFPGTATSVNTN